MTNNIAFKTQIASIMEVLANAAVAEICKLIDDDYAVLRLEISQSQNENRTLKRKLQMMELKMARERAERTIRERTPSARSGGGRASVMERNRGWRGGGQFQTRDRFLVSQGENSWRNRRCFPEEQPTRSKPTSQIEEPTVIELEDPAVQIKQEMPEAVLQEPEGTSWKRIVGPVCDGMVSHTVTADPLTSSAEQPGSRPNVVEALKTDLDLPLTKRDEQVERQIEASTSSFSLTSFKEAELSVNSAGFPSSCIGEHSVPPPMEHSAFNCVIKMESDEVNSCAELNGPSTSEGQWTGTFGMEWNTGLASERTDDPGSTSATLEVSGSDSTHRLQTERLSCASNERRADRMTWEMSTCGAQWGIASEGQSEGGAPQLVPISRPSDEYTMPSLGSAKCQIDVFQKRTSDHGQVASVLAQVTKDDFLARKNTDKANGKNATRKLFPCLLCGRAFNCPKQVEIHHRVHTGEKPFRCTLCPASFSVAGNLKRHQRVHTGEKPFSCPQCNRRFSLRHQLQKHLRCHSGEKPFSCFRCGKRFAEKSYVRLHLQRSHGVCIN